MKNEITTINGNILKNTKITIDGNKVSLTPSKTEDSGFDYFFLNELVERLAHMEELNLDTKKNDIVVTRKIRNDFDNSTGNEFVFLLVGQNSTPLVPAKPDTNAHRIGKYRIDANLNKDEAQSVVDALKKSGAKSQRELIVLLSELYNQGRI